MSLTYKDSKNAIPIAKNTFDGRIIFLLPESTVFKPLYGYKPPYKCPHCKKEVSTKTSLANHLKICPKQNQTIDVKPRIILKEYEFMQKLPLPLEEHEVIFATGPPKCGKSHWTNEYVKMFKCMYDLPVFRISRVDHDETLEKDADNYIHIPVSDAIVKDPFKLEDFSNSLVVFDDIESSECPKATQFCYNLLSDICKNGRHHKISLIFCNQESRMGMKTKAILSTVTSLVIFPKNASLYQTERLLKDHVGMSKKQISETLNLNTRWCVINKACPQYIIHEHGIYLLGKELY